MNKQFGIFITLVVFGLGFISHSSIAQTDQKEMVCGTTEYVEQMKLEDPNFAKNLQLLEDQTEQHINNYIENRLNKGNQKNSSVVKTIPMVFHVIHFGGPENISKAQIESAIDVLNEDFGRMNADTVDTPAPFKPLGADTEIEFKLAKIDPNGNCTDGIVRVYSSLTYAGNNTVKALSYWPSDKYLNVWVVFQAYPSPNDPRVGYSQFPGGNPLTDGIVMSHDYTGRIGAAANNQLGRWICHEAGHSFNLRHIWGDATCGNDFVADTPPADMSHSGCPTYPYHVNQCGAGSSPDGEMFSNYMDYTSGGCLNIFTLGQSARMDAALNSSVSNRNNLWTASNLIATGTDPGATASLCAPVASFNDQSQIICEGTILNFKDASWNGEVASWSWNFPGGTPATSTDSIVSVTYNNSGVYDVTLTVTNATGSDTRTATGIIRVLPALGQKGIPYFESFENITFPGTEWVVENEGGNAWEQNTLAAKTGANSVYLNNYSGNPTGSDAFITPTYNLSWSTSHSMTFEMAFAIRSSQSTDQLKVYASTTCGQLWNIRYSKSGSSLATAGLISTPFFPNANQWATQSVSISSTSYNNKPNVRFKFEYLQNTAGNNIFIDDINIDGTVGIDEALAESLDLNIYPNPVKSVATVNFKLEESHKVYIDVLDVMGKTVNKITEATLAAGEYQFELPADLTIGLYNVRIFIDGRSTSKKVLISH